MTRNEVIKHLKFIKDAYENLIKNDVREGTAISEDFEGEWKADQPLTQFYDTMIKALTLGIELIAGMATDDCISRQAVLDMMQMRMGGKELYKAVYDLPPVTPQSKMAESEEA